MTTRDDGNTVPDLRPRTGKHLFTSTLELTLLTLGVHAQRGLRLCVCYQFFCHRTLQCAQQGIPSASAGHKKGFKFGVFCKKIRSGIMAIFVYSTTAAIFLAVLSMRIPTCVVETCDFDSMERIMRLRK